MAFNQGCKGVVPRQGLSPRFLQYVLIAGTSNLRAAGNGSTFQEVSTDALSSLEIPDVPVDKQWRIADFLDDRVARIDQIITSRQKQAAFLRASAHSRRDSLVARQDGAWVSGSVRRFMRSLDARRIPLSSEERAKRHGEFPYYGASGVIDSVDDFLLDAPTVLVSEDGANLLLRSTPIAFVARGKYWVNNHAHILEPLDGIHDFWAARIEAVDVSPWVTGSAQPKLTIDAAMSLPVSAPRSISKRRHVAEQVIELQQELGEHLKALNLSVKLMQEYKQALITAAVTGELDVTTAGSGILG